MAMDDKQDIATSRTASKKFNSRPSAAGLSARSIDLHAAQCQNCFKWRLITTLEEYEEIRSEVEEKPFVCERKYGGSCKDPADIDYDSTRVWVIDKPGIPKTPEGFKRSLVLRRDFSKMDAYYFTPAGKKLRTRNEVAAFLNSNPKYSDLPISDFTFQVPKVMDDTIPGDVVRKTSACGDGKKKK
ncbi:hypothetical protein Ddye_016744 [Dipteronia dyeriana]|uniref:Uncharacterized protein n=1 Tax=Dipteronia dyeriana TaxID=168575 RepID=A0AAD9U887_9ROSI|nr:hypothetical protein Ddye_016744 [Dipteronia dyeriana]